LGAILVLANAVLAHAAPAATRKSADGIELPPAADHKFHVIMPFVATVLGARPEEIGHVFNTKQSAELLAKKTTTGLESEWFVINHDGADVVGLSLTDGRVSKAVLYFQTITDARIAAVRKQLDAHSDNTIKVTIKPITDDTKKQSLVLVFEADPIEFYIATHAPTQKIIDGLRAHTYVDGMTDAEAIMIGDGPGRFVATYAGDSKNADTTGADTVFADGTPDISIEFDAKNKHDAKEQALKRHKNLKDLRRISDLPPADSKDPKK
jgi:hypothetical protein